MAVTGLKLSKDRKVSPLNRLRWVRSRQRDQWDSVIDNSFGLPAGTACPGKTKFCESCYGKNAELQPSVRNLLRHNYDLLVDAPYATMVNLLNDLMDEYEKRWRRRLDDVDMFFRIHWDGDFFDLNYFHAWMQVIAERPHINFWCYTRSFDLLHTDGIVSDLPNLALYLSIDAENVEQALELRIEYPWLLGAWCADTFRSADRLADKRVTRCPENARVTPLVGDDGRGACVSCKLCITGKKDIAFSSLHREDVAVQIHRKQQVLF